MQCKRKHDSTNQADGKVEINCGRRGLEMMLPNRNSTITYRPIASLKWKSFDLTDLIRNDDIGWMKEGTAYY
jgi:hypothetical protein